MADVQLSVIVPAHNSEAVLELCLSALEESDLIRSSWELIVVNDGSTDRTAAIAGRYAERVVDLAGRPRGPAFARNRGAEVARASLLAFVDSDVSVAGDALRRLLEHLQRDAGIVGVFGSYDDRPTVGTFVSQYRNLLHHYVHHRNAGDSQSFWAGCGALRADPFHEVGAFDERRYPRAQIEDVELGYRLRDRGYRLLLDPSIQCTHHKKWTLASMLRADLLHRGIPWMQLLLERGRVVGGTGPSLGAGEKVSAALAGMTVFLLMSAAIFRRTELLVAAAISIVAIGVLNRNMLRWFSSKRGPAFAARTFGMVILYHITNVASGISGVVAHFARARIPAGAAPRS
ncbi:MAG: glycosyltransferase [Gemmatimonadaceae bacterium]|nr:glycosyltransferase [Gemmatimonadaceae bacterium]MDQ3242731.1 glycosyltransferase [Gemmatimonadota bacterium]